VEDPGSTTPDHSLTGNKKYWANFITIPQTSEYIRLVYLLIVYPALFFGSVEMLNKT